MKLSLEIGTSSAIYTHLQTRHSLFTFDVFLAHTHTHSLAATRTLTPARIAAHRDATCRTYCLYAHIKINQNNFCLVESLRIVSAFRRAHGPTCV